MPTKEELEREIVLLVSAHRIFLVRDRKIANTISERIDNIEKELKNGNYKDHEDSRG